MKSIALRLGLALALLAAIAADTHSAHSPLVEQGRAALLRGDEDAAIELLEKAVAQTPKSADAHYYLANAYGGKAQRSGMLGAATYGPKVKGEFEAAVALDPRHVDARFGLVEFYAFAPAMMGGSIDKALEQAKEIKGTDPTLGHRAYAFIYSQQKKLDLANREYADAIREQPASARPHAYFGQYLANIEKNYPAAFAEFETALKLDPKYMPALYSLGRTAALGETNLDRGEEALKKYLAYTPKEKEPTHASAHYYLGTIQEKKGNKTEAKQSYEAALKLYPTHKQALEGLKRVS